MSKHRNDHFKDNSDPVDDGDDELTNEDDDDDHISVDSIVQKRKSRHLNNRNSSSNNKNKHDKNNNKINIDNKFNSRNLGIFEYLKTEVESLGSIVADIVLDFFKNTKFVILLSILVHFAAIYLLFTLPTMGSNTYVSEKNLQCTVKPFITSDFSENAIEYANQFNTIFPSSRSVGSINNINSAMWIRDEIEKMGVETQLHYFNSSFGNVGVNVIGVNRAPRSLGTECFVLTTSFDQWHSGGSVGFLLAFLSYLQTTSWQARDVLFVFTSEGGESNGGSMMDISGISVWLNDYNQPPIGWTGSGAPLLRAGQIYGAISLDRIGNKIMEKLVIYPEGLSGALSNLDIINVVTTTSYLNEIPAGIITQFGEEDDDGSVNGLLVFMWNSALSMPRSNHAIFTRYGINAVGVSTYSNHTVWDMDFLNNPLHKEYNRIGNDDFINLSNETMYNMGKIIETSLRHLHNADEQLHQSFTWYMMAGAVFFIDLGQALLPLIVFSASLGLILISMMASFDGLNYSVIYSLPWTFSLITFCLMELQLPKIFSKLHLIPSNKNLIPANLQTTGILSGYTIEDQIIIVAALYILACILFYFTILLPLSNYLTSIVSKFNGKPKNQWAGLHSILIAYYSLLSLMGMMLNNQFSCLFIVISIPTLHFTTYILIKRSSVFIRSLWMVLCLLSHPLFLVFEWWGTSSVGWKRTFIGIIIGNEWGFLFWPYFILLLQPMWLGMFKLLFLTPPNDEQQQQEKHNAYKHHKSNKLKHK
ncbi:hypothetical protein PPL_03861 [Heterostelium album PN500]|uniref:Uncharacterized protein n=1 Tax=Heterostelium pallidum (strain ATCC 26659 / Pp 5 / PN500) TaxID=670386 RepID=D3B6V3_HETP5|nr:hypothetical protein PPL_03861 [Heterostelium album PN500]EFA83073.1 hypothetical protein PPL_03861 [Heterostelium album PN500]|eukprot:XP_020435190.1 hypothetical protein PPL_03861 [Heterostelium album PN500]